MYYQQLTEHLEELEKAKQPGEDNQAKFLLAFNNFKLFAVRNWNQIDIDFDQKTRRQIEEVF
jgi:DNA-binding sugar fermentation-stimulating protein